MINGLELKMMKKMPRGRYLTAIENRRNETVPTAHRKISVGVSSLGMSEKKFNFSCLTMRADALKLKSERKKANS